MMMLGPPAAQSAQGLTITESTSQRKFSMCSSRQLCQPAGTTLEQKQGTTCLHMTVAQKSWMYETLFGSYRNTQLKPATGAEARI
jgi:hypothetical protein